MLTPMLDTSPGARSAAAQRYLNTIAPLREVGLAAPLPGHRAVGVLDAESEGQYDAASTRARIAEHARRSGVRVAHYANPAQDAMDGQTLRSLADRSERSVADRYLAARALAGLAGRSAQDAAQIGIAHARRGAVHHARALTAMRTGAQDSLEGVPANAYLAHLSLAPVLTRPADIEMIVPRMMPGAASWLGAEHYIGTEMKPMKGVPGSVATGGSTPELSAEQGNTSNRLTWWGGVMNESFTQRLGLDFARRSGMVVIGSEQAQNHILNGVNAWISDRQLFGDTTIGFQGLLPRANYQYVGALASSATVDSVLQEINAAVGAQLAAYVGATKPDSMAISERLNNRLAIPYAISGSTTGTLAIDMLRAMLREQGITNVVVVESLDRVASEDKTTNVWGASGGYAGILLYHSEGVGRVVPRMPAFLPVFDQGLLQQAYIVAQVGEVYMPTMFLASLLVWQLT